MPSLFRTFHSDGLYIEHVAPESPLNPGHPPLLLVHGAGHGAWCWEQWMRLLPGLGWEAYAVSLRNHPGSRTVFSREFLEGTRVEDYANDVARAAREIGRPAIVIGHSMGGIVTQRFVSREGSLGRPAAAMVLLAAAPPAPLGPLRKEPLPLNQGYLPSPEEARLRYFNSASDDVVMRALARLVPESPSVMNEYSLGPGLPINPKDFHCPALVVSAGKDGTLVPRDRRIADLFSCDYLEYPSSGHDLMLEANAEAVLRDVLGWAEKSIHG